MKVKERISREQRKPSQCNHACRCTMETCRGETSVPTQLFRVLIRRYPQHRLSEIECFIKRCRGRALEIAVEETRMQMPRDKNVSTSDSLGKEVEKKLNKEKKMDAIANVKTEAAAREERKPRLGFCHNCGEPLNEICAEQCPKICYGENEHCPFNPDFVEFLTLDGRSYVIKVSEELKEFVVSDKNLCGECKSSWENLG